jgi:hypothetical protein
MQSSDRRRVVGDYWPILVAISTFAAILIISGPWSNLPVNDDWQYAHVAKNFAATGMFRLDVRVAPAVVGQSIIAFPIIRIFGFSHLALRLLTLALSVTLLLELDYLMKRGGADARARLLSLCLVAANPIFLHLATSFMTEIYGFAVAFLGACLWYPGKERRSKTTTIAAAIILGSSFWIRQFCALLFPALLVAEWLVERPSMPAARGVIVRRAAEIFAWCSVVGVYFIWAHVTKNEPGGAEQPWRDILHPDVVAFILHAGLYFFYVAVFFIPFFLAVADWKRGIPSKLLTFGLIGGAVALTTAFGHTKDAPYGVLNATFPFLTNVLSKYSIGPPTISDVYFGQVQLTPLSFFLPWLIVELVGLAAVASWPNIIGLIRAQRNEIALMGFAFAIVSLIAVLLTYRKEVFDRYHFPGILGFALALAVCFPTSKWMRLRNVGVIAVAIMAVFSTFALHDHFRWQEARLELLQDAQRAGLKLSDVYAGYEFDGWNAVEGIALSPGCNLRNSWFCRERRYRIGVRAKPGENVLFSRPVDSWLIRFPDLKLFDRSTS